MPAVAAAVCVGLALAMPAMAAFPPSAEGTSVAVATDHSEATRAALETLHNGGNAVDAAITAALTLGVVNPTASGIGGGGFALVYMAKDKKVRAIDFREAAPQRLAPQEIFARAGRFGGEEDVAKRGASIGVPGEPAGLEWLSKTFGKLSLAEDVAPAVRVATRGFAAGRHLEFVARFMARRLGVSPELATTFLPGGAPLAYRAAVTRPELARTLARFGTRGAAPFYDGEIAQKIVRAAQAAGGGLEMTDMAAYRVREREPLSRAIDGRTVVTMPAPSGGGMMLLEVLGMYGASAASPLKAMGFGSSAYLHTLAEAMRGAVADRVRGLGDPDLEPRTNELVQAALEPAQLAARRARIDPNRTHSTPDFRTREQGTSHLIVADRDGNVVALTTTINDPFGARVVAGNTGILLNDELDDFSSPGDLRGFGVVGLGPNRPRGGARPVSSMTPTIVFENDAPILALGGSGGFRIATAVTQAAVARLVFGLDPGACVSAPRIHVTGSQELMIDAEVTEDVRDGLRRRGENVREEPFQMSAVQMVAWDRRSRRVFAASDPRKIGFSAAE